MKNKISFQVWFTVLAMLILIGPITVTVNYLGKIALTAKGKIPKNNMFHNQVRESRGFHNNGFNLTPHQENLQGRQIPGTAADDSFWLKVSSSLPQTYFNMYKSLIVQENNLPNLNISISILLVFWYFFGFIIDGENKNDNKWNTCINMLNILITLFFDCT